jgi:hypothetical protein
LIEVDPLSNHFFIAYHNVWFKTNINQTNIYTDIQIKVLYYGSY